MSRKKILYVVTDPISTRLLRGQLAMLVDEGYDVGLACAAGQELDSTAQAEGATAHPVPMVRQPSPLHDLRALLALIVLMARERPALVHASTPKAGLLATLAAWITRRPVRVYLVRGLRFETMDGRSRRVFLLVERMVCAMATHVVFNSESARETALREGIVRSDRAEIIGSGSSNGVDLTRFAELPCRDEARRRAGVGGTDPVVGFVGRLTADKGIDDAVEVVDRLVAEGRQVRLLVVGDVEPGDPPSERTRSKLADDPHIAHVEWVADPAWLYAAMDVFLFPSRREGLPNAPLEAQACGLPIVACAATGTVDALVDGSTAVLVPIGDVDAMTDAVAALLDDPDRRVAMGAAGRAFVAERFDRRRVWSAIAAAYAEWSS